MNLLFKIPVMFWVILGAAYLGYDWNDFETSVESPLLMKRAELEANKQSVQKLQQKVTEGQAFVKSFEQKREEVRGIFTRLNEIKFSIADEIDPAAIMKLLTNEGKAVGISLVSIFPKPPKEQEFYVEYPFEIKFKGVYVQLVVFLKKISNLVSIMTIEDVDVKSTGTSHGKYADIEGTIHVKGYRYRSSKADDFGKEKPGEKK